MKALRSMRPRCETDWRWRVFLRSKRPMTQNARIYSLLIGGIGAVSLLLGALLAFRSAFGTALYDVGLLLHLPGIAGCLYAIRISLPQAQRFEPDGADAAASRDRLAMRQARFKGRTQAIRIGFALVLFAYGVVSLGRTARNLSELLALRRFGQRFR